MSGYRGVWLVAFALLAIGCNRQSGETGDDTTQVPIGPGTDTSVLRPPDTPQSQPPYPLKPDSASERKKPAR